MMLILFVGFVDKTQASPQAWVIPDEITRDCKLRSIRSKTATTMEATINTNKPSRENPMNRIVVASVFILFVVEKRKNIGCFIIGQYNIFYLCIDKNQ